MNYFPYFVWISVTLLVACEPDDDQAGQETEPSGGKGGAATGGRGGGGAAQTAGANPGGASVGGVGGLGFCSARAEVSGYVDCKEGLRHRLSRQACKNSERDEQVAPGACDIEGECCESDSDCGASSACWASGVDAQGENYGVCSLRCETDDDCESGQICECGAAAGRCVAATCATDSDCAGTLCVRSMRDEGCGPQITYSCQTQDDECLTDSDCDNDGPDFETCATNGARRVCLDQFQSCDG